MHILPLKNWFPVLILVLALSACNSAQATPVEPINLTAPTPLILTAPAQTQPAPSVAPPVVVTATREPLPLITLPISIYILDDVAGNLSSQRDIAQVEAIMVRVNEIWAQANIVVEVQNLQRLSLPENVLQPIFQTNFRPFFAGLEVDYAIPEPSLINGFFARNIGGPNGIVPFGANLFFVADVSSVHDERVTSHEIGHILGLHHTRSDAGRLLYSGTNGMTLTEEEIVAARYAAQGLLGEE